MARIDTLDNFLTDVATAIKNKKGDNSKILASEFDIEITNLPSGGDSELEASFASLIDGTFGANTTKLPTNITEIGAYAFQGCTNLALTKLPDGVTEIGDSAFRECTNLTLTELPETVTTIGSSAFYYCSNLALTKLPNGLTKLGAQSFYRCSNLEIKEIPSGVTSFPGYTFIGCDKITELTIKGDNLLFSINAFNGCSNLAKMVLLNVTSVPRLSNVNAFTNTPIASGTGYVYVPDTLVDSFKTATNWSDIADQIKPISELEASA